MWSIAALRAAAGSPAFTAAWMAMDHITYVERAMAQAERSGDWQRVSRLSLKQRAGEQETARRRGQNETGAATRESGKTTP